MRAVSVSLAFIVLLPPLSAEGQTSKELEIKAAEAFQEGIEHRLKPLQARRYFSDAADLYRELHDKGEGSATLYLNLGNAAVLANRWPEGLWAYHMGLKLDPNDRRLRENRDSIRGKVANKSSLQGQPDAENWPTWLYRPSPGWLTGIALTTYAIGWFTAAVAFLRKSPRWLLAAGLPLLIALVSGLSLWYEIAKINVDRETPLIIVKEDTPLFRGNGWTYPRYADVTLLKGMEARQQHRRGAWLQIQLSTGELGWVPRERVLVVEP